MACERYLNALLEHAAGAPAPAGLLRHLESCPGCAGELAALRKAIAISERTLREVVATEPSPALLASVRRSVLAPRTRTAPVRRWVGWTVGAAGLVAAALAVVILVPRHSGVEEREAVAVARRPVPVAESSEPRPETRVRPTPLAEPVAERTASPERSTSGTERRGAASHRASTPPPASTTASPSAPPSEREPPGREGEPGPPPSPEVDWRVAALPPLPAPEGIVLDPPPVARIAVPALEIPSLRVEPIAEPAGIEAGA
jgi:hypothetical protein